MKCVILAAGYATRLYPLTKNTAKPLLPIGDQKILDHIIRKVEKVVMIDEIYIVTNDRFYNDFIHWHNNYEGEKTIQIINDKTTSNDDRFGAIADLQYVIEQTHLQDDVLVMAGDNVFDFELVDFIQFYEEVEADCITMHQLEDLEEIQQTGVVEVDAYKKVISFEEKPTYPRSNLAVPPFYIYKKETLPLIKKYIDNGEDTDAPGSFIPWLIQYKDVHAYEFTGRRYDIGTLESYEQVKEGF